MIRLYDNEEMIFWVQSKPTAVGEIYSTEQQWRTRRLQSKKTTEWKRICSEVAYRQTVWGIRGNSWVKHMKAPV